jgi:hypothetical protein
MRLSETSSAMVDGANGAATLCRRIAGPIHDVAGSNAGRRLRAAGVRHDRSSGEYRRTASPNRSGKRGQPPPDDLMVAVANPQERREPTYVGYKFVGQKDIIRVLVNNSCLQALPSPLQPLTHAQV